jgi:hypothetical protein
MSAIDVNRINDIAEQCLAEMGDVFWDYDPVRDHGLDFEDPHERARSAVIAALQRLAYIMHKYNSSLNSQLFFTDLRLIMTTWSLRVGARTGKLIGK